VDSRDLDFDAESLKRKFKGLLNSIDTGGKKVVVCREALSGNYPSGENAKRIAERLYAVFGDVKILIVIREQFSMLAAIYSEYIKIGGTLSFKEFIYDPIISPGLIEKLKYHKIIDLYSEIFGEDNVFVGLFEDFREDNESFANRVFHFIGCANNPSLIDKECVVNPSLRKLGLELQRFANHFLRSHFNTRKPFLPIDQIVALFLTDEKKKILLDAARNRLVYSMPGCDDDLVLRYAISFGLVVRLSRLFEKVKVGPKFIVPAKIKNDLEGVFAESNNLLRVRYNLPVEKFGWSL
jgi:hypothetical protein